jgi:hypothetical protein
MICLVDNTMGCLGNTINLVTIQKLLKLGYVAPILKSWLQVLYGCHHNLVDRYVLSIHKQNFLPKCFFSLSLQRLLSDLTVFISNTAGVL